MIFPVLELEGVVQVDDKTRLDAEKSYVTPDEAAVTLIEIEPDSALGYIDVTAGKYLDWQYATGGDKTVTVRVTTDGAPVSVTKTLSITTAADDKLFSSDPQLIGHEADILDYVQAGRNSFLDVHRTAQVVIVAWLDEHRIWDNNGDRLTKAAIIDVDEVAQWSKYLTLRLIFEGISNSTDDIFHEKSMRYEKLEIKARNRGAIKLDKDSSGELDADETVDLRSLRLVRR